jgi:hypothetical protein
MSERNEKMK